MTNHGNPTHSAAFQTPRAARGHNRQGFTLIELMVACLLLALLAAVIGWSVRGPILASRLTQTVERIRHADRLAREMARRGGGDVRLTFDAGDGRITLQRAGRTVRQTGLPTSVRMTALRLPRRRSRDRIRVPVSVLGQSPTYAIRIQAGDETPRWLIVSGLTGQVVESRTAEPVDAMLRL